MIFPVYFHDFRSIFDALLFEMLKLPLFSENAVFETRTWDFKTNERLRDFAFMSSLNVSLIAKVQTSSTCRQNCSFPETSSRLLKNENPTNSSVEFPLNTVCCLARLRKFELTPATSCQDREFRYLCEIATSKVVWIVFPQKVLGFREERKPEAFWK